MVFCTQFGQTGPGSQKCHFLTIFGPPPGSQGGTPPPPGTPLLCTKIHVRYMEKVTKIHGFRDIKGRFGDPPGFRDPVRCVFQ